MAEKEWDPSQPLEDAELEKEAVERARQRSRVKYLEDQQLSKVKQEKKKKGFFED